MWADIRQLYDLQPTQLWNIAQPDSLQQNEMNQVQRVSTTNQDPGVVGEWEFSKDCQTGYEAAPWREECPKCRRECPRVPECPQKLDDRFLVISPSG
jgi:hypothetical protein